MRVSSHAEIIKRLDELEERVSGQDETISDIITAIKRLTESEPVKKPKI